MEWVKTIVPLVPPILKTHKPVTEHVVYPFKLSSNVRSLESAIAELKDLKEDVQTEITNAERENGVPTEEVKWWLENVEAIETKAEQFCESYQQLSRCIWNISPNLLSNYKISRNAENKTVQAKRLLDKKVKIPVIICMPPPLAQEMSTSSSIAPNLNSALLEIRNSAHNIIGVWGMGGVGKTHLLKQINNELCRDGSFNVVVFVTCSKECYEEKLQDEIIDKLSLSKNGNTEQKRNTIYNFLNRRNFVLLLDDLWSRLDLEMIGIPNPMVTVATCKRKIVLTTRSTEVCGQMEAKRKIKVDVLKWDDAWSIFKENVTEETINSNALIQRYAVDIAKDLGGLSLALITIGRVMHDKTDPKEWELANELLKHARLDDVEFPSTNESIFTTLKFSFDNLRNETLKQCFLHCSLLPEDYWIRKSDLIEFWMGLGLIDELNIHTAYNSGYSYIRRLQAACLLETDDDYDVVKMHDVIRDMALWIANNQVEEKIKWVVKARKPTKPIRIEISKETEKLSLMMGEREVIFLSTTCSSSKLSTLFLQQNCLCDCKPLQLDAFSKLVVLDLSRNNIIAFPAEICTLEQLQFLNLSWNINLTSLLPEELGALINLKYMLLRNTSSCTIPNGVLSKLKALRVLDLYRTSVKWADRSRSFTFTSLEEELQCLPHFQALGITIKNMHDYQMLSGKSTMPVRNLEIKLFEVEENCLSLASVLGKSQLQTSLFELTLEGMGRMAIEWVKFERESHVQSIYHFERLEELHFGWVWIQKMSFQDCRFCISHFVSSLQVFLGLLVSHAFENSKCGDAEA